MTKESDLNLQSKRLRQLVAELESPPGNKTKPQSIESQSVNLLSLCMRWVIFGIICAGSGFWIGTKNAAFRLSLRQPSETQLLNAQAWRNDGTGVFYRWCRGECHAPRLYGGGVIQIFEVKCVDRPCGDILMSFNVLNAKGEVVDKILFREKGLQGESRRFFVESQNADAASIELSDFSARARV